MHRRQPARDLGDSAHVDDLAVARQVQRALLPEASGPIASAFDMAIFHKQLAQVGGDYYDFFYLPGERHAIGVGRIAHAVVGGSYVRHPSHGGARAFRDALVELLA